MKSPRRWMLKQRISLWVLAGSFAWALGAGAQERLDPSFYSNAQSWSGPQRQQAESFVQRQVEAIQSGDEAAMSSAKTSLVGELNTPGANARFVEQLSEVVVEQLGPAVGSQDLKVRINAVIVLGNVSSADALPLVLEALSDENAGVRYLASKSLGSLLANSELPEDERKQALDQLQQQISSESDLLVVEPMLEALLRSRDNGRVLAVLNERVSWHAANPRASFLPESTTFRTVFSNLFTATNRPQAQVQQLARAATRYTQMIATQLAATPTLAESDPSRLEILTVAVSALEFAHNDLRLPGATPPVGRFVEQRDWKQLVEASKEWATKLKQAPVSFSDDQLSISADGAE